MAGQHSDMTFVITHQEEKIKQLQRSALQITELSQITEIGCF